MTGHIVNAIEHYRKIARKYTGTEPDFNRYIEACSRIDAAMIRAELKIRPSMFYKWFEVMMIRDDLLPALEKIKDMETMKNFLAMPEIKLIDKLM